MSSDDIVTRLRRITARPLGLVIDPPPHPLCKEAADEIMRLRAEVERLRDENAVFRAQYAFADEIREAFAKWDGTDASLPEGWRRER